MNYEEKNIFNNDIINLYIGYYYINLKKGYFIFICILNCVISRNT